MTLHPIRFCWLLLGVACLPPVRANPHGETGTAAGTGREHSTPSGEHGDEAPSVQESEPPSAEAPPTESTSAPGGTAVVEAHTARTPPASADVPVSADVQQTHAAPPPEIPLEASAHGPPETPGDAQQNVISAGNLAAESAGHQHQPAVPSATTHQPAETHGRSRPDNLQEMRSILGMAQKYLQRNELKAAEEAIVLVIENARDKELLLEANLFYARILAKTQRWSEAAVVYERFIRYGEMRTDLPQVYLELGTLYRNLGAFELSLKRYYSVLNSTLRLGGEDLPAYRTLSQVTKFEIAETYAAMGDFANARKFFSRMQILDLPREVRQRAAFREAQTAFQDGEYARAAVLLQQFVEEYPREEKSIEASYMLVSSLQELKRYDDSLRSLLRLLAMTEEIGDLSPDSRLFWQKRAGNQLANLYYRQGDYTSSLMIYQAMAALKSDPLWAWPLQYQIGLCFEQLRQPTKAVEAYRLILQQAKEQADWKEKFRELQDVIEMAEWRLQHLGWKEVKEERIGKLQYAETLSADG